MEAPGASTAAAAVATATSRVPEPELCQDPAGDGGESIGDSAIRRRPGDGPRTAAAEPELCQEPDGDGEAAEPTLLRGERGERGEEEPGSAGDGGRCNGGTMAAGRQRPAGGS